MKLATAWQALVFIGLLRSEKKEEMILFLQYNIAALLEIPYDEDDYTKQ